MLDLKRRPMYVVGAAETPLGKVTDQSALGMLALAARDALDEAGMTLHDVDGLFTPYMGWMSSTGVAEFLGIQPRYLDSSDHGGSQFEASVAHAIAAIDAGLCEVALIGFASRQRSLRQRIRNVGAALPRDSVTVQFETPVDLPMPIGHFALAMDRHMTQFGTTPEAFAEIAVTARLWAQRNPKAWCRDPLSIDDVLASPLLCSPLRKLDMCLLNDGGGAVVVTNAARAKGARKPPVRILGAAEATTHFHVWSAEDLTTWAGAKTAREAMGMAGITPDDVDVFQPYDASTVAVMVQLSDVGFCKREDVNDFVLDGNLRPGGSLPSMTSGGGLSYNHPGAFGVQLLIESVRQARGEAGDRQVPRARVVLAHGIGGMYAASATVVLASD